MTPPRLHATLWLLLIVVVSSQMPVLYGQQVDDEADPVELVLELYDDVVQDIRSRPTITLAERQSIYRDWQHRIMDVLEANPKSAKYAVGLVKALSLCNGTGDFETSERLGRELVELKDSADWRATWTSELGEIVKSRFGQTRDTEDAKRSCSYFEGANELMKTLSDNGALQVTLQEQYVINLYAMGTLQNTSAEGRLRAAECFRQARQYMQDAKLGMEGRLSGHSPLDIGHHEMIAAIAGGDLKHALKTLDWLGQHPQSEQPPSYYALEFARHAHSKNKSEFCKMLQNWLDEHPVDSGTPMLKFYLARSLFESREFAKALPIYLQLERENSEFFLTQDEEQVASGSGGYYAEVLYNLAVTLDSTGSHDEAIRPLELFVSLYPRDDRYPDATALLEQLKTRHARGADLNHYMNTAAGQKRFLVLGLVNLGILIIVYSILARRWQRRKEHAV